VPRETSVSVAGFPASSPRLTVRYATDGNDIAGAPGDKLCTYTETGDKVRGPDYFRYFPEFRY
jgi:hypothetical protein